MDTHYYEESQQHVFWAIMIFITGLSVFGSLAIVTSYILFPQIRNANSRIILSLRYVFMFIDSIFTLLRNIFVC